MSAPKTSKRKKVEKPLRERVSFAIYKCIGRFPGEYWDGDFKTLPAAQKYCREHYGPEKDFRIVEERYIELPNHGLKEP